MSVIPNGYVYHYVGEIPKYEPWQELAFSDNPIPAINTEEELKEVNGPCFIPKWLNEKIRLHTCRISMFKHNRKPE